MDNEILFLPAHLGYYGLHKHLQTHPNLWLILLAMVDHPATHSTQNMDFLHNLCVINNSLGLK